MDFVETFGVAIVYTIWKCNVSLRILSNSFVIIIFVPVIFIYISIRYIAILYSILYESNGNHTKNVRTPFHFLFSFETLRFSFCLFNIHNLRWPILTAIPSTLQYISTHTHTQLGWDFLKKEIKYLHLLEIYWKDLCMLGE